MQKQATHRKIHAKHYDNKITTHCIGRPIFQSNNSNKEMPTNRHRRRCFVVVDNDYDYDNVEDEDDDDDNDDYENNKNDDDTMLQHPLGPYSCIV